MKIMELLRSAVMAGVCIGVAGYGYLAEKDIVGAVLFAFGLLTVVHYGLKLYTGTAGFVRKGEMGSLALILVGNLVGCLLVALMVRCSPMPLQETAQGILEGRLSVGGLRGGVLAVGCGFIMTTAVTFARQGKYLPLLFGVPLFIMCGFPHCVADAFYYMCVPCDFLAANVVEVLVFYVSIVVGNFVGCNLYRLVCGFGPSARVVLPLAMMAAMATGASAKSLVLTLDGGQLVYYRLGGEKNPMMRLTDDGVSIDSDEFTVSSIRNFYISDTDDPDGIDVVVADGKPAIRGNVISVGADVGIGVYAIDGRKMDLTVVGNGERRSVDINGLPKGEYIVKVGNGSFKIRK